MEEAYLGRGGRRRAYELLARPLRAWDRRTQRRVDRFVAISDYVGERIAHAYGRTSRVVYPPVDTDRFQPAEKGEDYFLVVSALVPYKRVDVVVEAFRQRTEELWVVGDGPLLARLRAKGPRNVRFLGWVDDHALPGLMARCRALIFPTEDEFGIVPVETQAAGRPVIALDRGGARETVVPFASGRPPTGVWFSEQTPMGVSRAVDHFLNVESMFEPTAIRAHALRFSRERFRSAMRREIGELLDTADSPGLR
jgi:glycosyltransferase involved in cell wall biosynthesis